MIGLGGDRLRGRLRQRDIVFERFVITFYFPPFVVDRSEGLERHRGVTGDQIANAGAAVFVCEDLLDQDEREVDSFQIDFPCGLRFSAGFFSY